MAADLRLRFWASLEFLDPEPRLVALREIERGEADVPWDVAQLPDRVRRLRTNDLKPLREARDAAIFAHGMARAVGCKVYYAPVEESDYDFVTTCVRDAIQFFNPVQLKELHPEDLAPGGSLSALFEGLAKYVESDTVLAVKLNRRMHIDFEKIEVPNVPFREVWLFGSAAPNANSWFLVGDLLSDPVRYDFSYPGESD